MSIITRSRPSSKLSPHPNLPQQEDLAKPPLPPKPSNAQKHRTRNYSPEMFEEMARSDPKILTRNMAKRRSAMTAFGLVDGNQFQALLMHARARNKKAINGMCCSCRCTWIHELQAVDRNGNKVQATQPPMQGLGMAWMMAPVNNYQWES